MPTTNSKSSARSSERESGGAGERERKNDLPFTLSPALLLVLRFGTEGKLTLGADWVVRQAPTLIADRDIDLVVLAGNSKPRLAGALLGTTAERLLERVEASVWVVRH